MKIVDVLGRIYGLSHLLSSERSNILQYSRVNVKDFLRIFAEMLRVTLYAEKTETVFPALFFYPKAGGRRLKH